MSFRGLFRLGGGGGRGKEGITIMKSSDNSWMTALISSHDCHSHRFF